MEMLPVVQFAVHSLAVLFLYHAMVVYGLRSLGSFLVALGLLLADVMRNHGNQVMSEAFTVSFAAIALGFIFFLTAPHTFSPKQRIVLWLGLAISVVMTILIRPAFLFFPFFCLLAGYLLGEKNGLTSRWKFYGLLLTACFLPTLGYGWLHQSVTGYFGVSNFRGAIMMAAVGPLLNKENVEQISPPLQPLAQAYIQYRDRYIGERRAVDRYPAAGTLPLKPNGEIHIREWVTNRVYYAAHQKSRFAAYGHYNVYQDPLRLPMADHYLAQLAGEVVQFAPQTYLLWVVGNYGQVLPHLFSHSTTLNMACLLLLGILITALLINKGRMVISEEIAKEMGLWAGLGGLFFLMATSLVAVSAYMDVRHVTTGGYLLLPAILLAIQGVAASLKP